MNTRLKHLIMVAVAACVAGAQSARAQQKSNTAVEIPQVITTPDKVQTRVGTLDFKDGMPSNDTVDRVYDNLDFTHAFEAFVNTYQGVNMAAAVDATAVAATYRITLWKHTRRLWAQ